ncbi:MAG: cell wall-binding repeat-containing protein [Catenulisporales bacterium]|nr:cell wall-binding repeat-containing protein [Catenulisporales bacterium]
MPALTGSGRVSRISQQRWTAGGSAKAVALAATSLNYPDALSCGPLAAKKDGPLLLTDGSASRLDARILAEIQRVLPAGGVHVSDVPASWCLGSALARPRHGAASLYRAGRRARLSPRSRNRLPLIAARGDRLRDRRADLARRSGE